MAKKRLASRASGNESVWVNNYVDCPPVEGHVEVTKNQDGVVIAGDPEGLRSLARLLEWIANVDQESIASQPDGERYHIHLHPSRKGYGSLTASSLETELCRLDAKGTGELRKARRGKAKN